eukprot:a677643_188.p1 GENE.a677643_188~~a677643_188.p1  ORF type:complete len:161 (+),score=52.38 a677643_188:39-485(+)
MATAYKVFVKRDFSHGEYPTKYITKLPQKLEGKVNPDTFADTVQSINEYFARAEDINAGMIAEGCCAFMSLFTLYWCVPSRYERRMNELETFLQGENENKYRALGMHWSHPKRSAFRHIVVSVDPNMSKHSSRRNRANSSGSRDGPTA